MEKKKIFTIEMDEEQFRLMAGCIEDINRFISGDCELFNSVCVLENDLDVRKKLKEMHPLVTPDLPMNACYGWNGGDCPNEEQTKFIAKTYYLYREMLHKWVQANGIHNVYSSETLRCKDSGRPIKITYREVEE